MTKEQVFQIFGHITVMYATLDFFITSFLTKIVTEEWKEKGTIQPDTSIGKKLNTISKLNCKDVKHPDILEKSQKLLLEAFEIAEQRNRFIHDNWIFSPDDLKNGFIKRVTIKALINGDFKPEISQPYTEQSLSELIGKIGKLQISFADLYEELEKKITNK